MRMKDCAKVLGGSVAVYVLIAACGASTGGNVDVDGGGPIATVAPTGTAPPSGSSSSASSSGASSGSAIDAMLDAVKDVIVDAVTDPVPDVQAAPPEALTVACVETAIGALAEQAYPGKTADELALTVRATVNFANVGAGGAIPNYRRVTRDIWVRDGFATCPCGNAPAGTTCTFLRQP